MIIILLKGSQIFIEALKEQGVDVVFGFPGGAVLDIYHELGNSDIKHILVRHEQGAVHAADGYARASGKVGVCIVTSGPGATNTVSGIATAYMDSSPIVVFTGQVPTALIGNDAFQEVDIVGITRPCTKHNYLVRDVRSLHRVIKEAFYIAKSGRPGPVLVDLPKDVMGLKAEFRSGEEINLRSYRPCYEPNFKQLYRVVQLIKESKRPLIMTGGGVRLSRASQELRSFSKKILTPVTSTLMGLGTYPSDDPLWLGMVGMHGTYCANMATAACDLLIGIGVRFDDRVTGRTDRFAPNAKIIHIDIDPSSIRKTVPVSVPVVGDCKTTLRLLLSLIEKEDFNGLRKIRRPWIERLKRWKNSKPFRYSKDTRSIKPQYVIERIDALSPADTIITTEVGQNQMWTAQYYKFNSPNSFITSGGLGCMGFGFPAAIGAQVAFPDRTVIDIAGDGSIQMNIQELATAVQYRLPVKVAILNNRYLGMVRQWQELFYERNYSYTEIEHEPDFVKLAEAYGAIGLRATRKDEVDDVIREALKVDMPVIMEFQVEQEENVFPIVPAGAPITDMIYV